MRTPDKSEPILLFAQGLSPSNPLEIPVTPRSWSQPGDCVPTVRRVIDYAGGTMILGWRLWEWPDVFVEAEFHAVWQMEDGTFQDPSPNEFGVDPILFVPDSTLVEPEDFAYPDNILKPLGDDQLLIDFVQVLEAKNAPEALESVMLVSVMEPKLTAMIASKYGPEPNRD